MKAPFTFSPKPGLAFLVAGLVALVINYVGSLWFRDELRLNWPIILIVACLAALISYLISLRRYVAALEERISTLEQKLKNK